MKTFCEEKLFKKDRKMSKQPLTSKFEQVETISFPLFSSVLKKDTFSLPKNGFTLYENNTKTGNNQLFSILWPFFLAHPGIYIYIYIYI